MAQNWFQHDYNARNDDKILELRAEYGWKGYGLFYAFIETMCENETGAIDSDKIGGLSIAYSLPKEELLTFIDFCLSIKLFYRDDDGLLRNERITKHVKKMQSFREAGRKGAKKRWSGESDRGGIAPLKTGNKDPNTRAYADKSRVDKSRKENKSLLSDLTADGFDVSGTVDEKINWTTVRFYQRAKVGRKHYKIIKNATLQDWREPIRLMHTSDGLSFERIWAYLKFLFEDDFWKNTVYSTAGFRKNWQEIDTAMKRRNAHSSHNDKPEHYIPEKPYTD